MHSPKLAWVAVLAGAMLLILWLGTEPQAGVDSAAPQALAVAQAAAGTSPATNPTPQRPTDKPTAQPPVTPAAAWATVRPLPALDRALAPPYPRFEREDRTWLVLGTRQGENAKLTQQVLVLQEEKSGQLEYRQSMLSFSLQPGQDYEAFIRERPQLRRRFVNALYAEVEVDAAQIAAQYTALAQDSRVSRVGFVGLRAPLVPR